MANGTAKSDNERAVGIDVFASPTAPGFGCVFKQRYTDFLVNEILPDGMVLHLLEPTSTDLVPARHAVDNEMGQLEDTTTSAVAGQKRTQEDVIGEAPEEAEGTSLKRQRVDGDVQPEEKVRQIGHVESSQPLAAEAKTSDEDLALAIEAKTSDEVSAAAPGAKTSEQNLPVAPEAKTSEEDLPLVSEAKITAEDLTTLNGMFGIEVARDIVQLYCDVLRHPDRKARDHRTVISRPMADRGSRTEAHMAVRKVFASKLETNTLQDPQGALSIKAMPPRGGRNANKSQSSDAHGAKQKAKVTWDQLGGEYLHFTLYKENKDTMEVLFYIASQLKVTFKHFQFAGTKDRRGVTVQRVSAYRIMWKQLSRVQSRARGWKVADHEYKKHALELGELTGNEFVLTLRECRFPGAEGLGEQATLSHAREATSIAIAAFADKGFVNYYGLQRFGSFSAGTHETGVKMLQGDLQGAVDTILAYDASILGQNQDTGGGVNLPEEDITRARAIKIWREQKSSRDACAIMPKRFQAEYSIIQYLGRKDKRMGRLAQERDWQGALMSIQRNLRLMYVHAYQSFVWNTVAGLRWRQYGDKVMEGDLVIVGDKDGAGPTAQEVDEQGEPIVRPGAEDRAALPEDEYLRARALSKEEAESGDYDIFDIVLPLPGYDVEYPKTELGKFYETFMASDAGGHLDPHNMRRAWKDISLSGSYRKVMARPSNLSAEVRTYVSETEQLVETDLQRVNRSQEPDGEFGGAKNRTEDSTKDGGGGGGGHLTSNPQQEPEPEPEKRLAVVLKMQLGSSQYATMALRELTKGGAVQFQADFNANRRNG